MGANGKPGKVKMANPFDGNGSRAFQGLGQGVKGWNTALGHSGSGWTRLWRGPGQGFVTGTATGALVGAQTGGVPGAIVGAGVGGAYGAQQGMEKDRFERQMKRQAEDEAETAGSMARQQSIAGGLGGGGVQSATDVGAYAGVMNNYANQAYQMQQAQQARQLQSIQLMMMLYGYSKGAGATGGVKEYNESGGFHGSAGSFGPSEFGE